jgi:hypothetical protein
MHEWKSYRITCCRLATALTLHHVTVLYPISVKSKLNGNYWRNKKYFILSKNETPPIFHFRAKNKMKYIVLKKKRRLSQRQVLGDKRPATKIVKYSNSKNCLWRQSVESSKRKKKRFRDHRRRDCVCRELLNCIMRPATANSNSAITIHMHSHKWVKRRRRRSSSPMIHAATAASALFYFPASFE